MNITIVWNSLKISEWEQRFSQISGANLLQSYNYARAACTYNRQKARWGLIMLDGQEAGLVQILEIGAFGNLLHAVMLDRGPLWFEGFGNFKHFQVFSKEFARQFPRRIGRRRRFIPEIADSPQIQEFLSGIGFKRHGTGTYETIHLDLNCSEEELRSAMKKKWRNALSKAERAKLSIEWDEGGEHLPWLLKTYAIDKAQKNYDGPAPDFIVALGQVFVPAKKMLIARALLDNRSVGAILILCHGSGATYQIGWASQDGRDTNANHLLLWDACTALKKRGIKSFDLGGINDDKAKGVKKFKEGMGGEIITLPGLFT